MRTRAAIFLLWSTVLLLSSGGQEAFGAGEVSLSVEANRSSMFVGETLVLRVTVQGSQSLTPDLSGITDWTVQQSGSASSSGSFSFSFGMGGGRRQSVISRTFSYLLTPKKTGRLEAGPVTVKSGSKTITTRGPVIQVAGIEKQEYVWIEVASSKDSVLIDEPFEITLSLGVKQLPAPYEDVHPFSPNDPPHLRVPFLDDMKDEDIEQPNLNQLLVPFVVTGEGGGFRLNGYLEERRGDPFGSIFGNRPFGSLFDEPRPYQFRFERSEEARDGHTYHIYTVRATYRIRKAKTVAFGPVEFKGKVIAGVDEQRRGIPKRIYAIGPAVNVQAVPPPEEGRPPSFVGALTSNLVASASLDAQTCRVGDPLTLTLILEGAKRPERLRAPDLTAQADLTRDFRIYPDTLEKRIEGGRVIFNVMLRPMRGGTFELPPIAVGFFDTESRSYRVVHTEPIPLRAEETDRVGLEQIIGIETNGAANNHLAQVEDSRVVAAITLSPKGMESSRFFDPRFHGWLLAVGPLGFGIVLLGRLSARAGRRLAERRARHNGLLKAREMLRQVDQVEGVREQALHISDALRTYLAYRLGVSESDITPEWVSTQLSQKGVAADRVEDISRQLARHTEVAFAPIPPSDYSGAAEAEAATGAIDAVELSFRKGRRLP